MIVIVGCRGISPDSTPEGFFYIGPAARHWQESPLHNAFPVYHDNMITHARRLYKAWLWEVMQDTESAQRKELDRIVAQAKQGTAILGCWDWSNPMAADIVKAAAEYLLKQEHATA